MFQRNKNNYRVEVVCTDGTNIGRYSFIESCDDDWGEIAEQKFEDEFGTSPSQMSLESRERV